MMRRAAAVATLSLVVGSVACGRGTRVTVFGFDGHPSALVVVGSHVWVSDDVNHSLHVLDASTGAEVGSQIPVPETPIALAAGGGSVWVAHADGSVSAVDVRTREVREHKLGGSLTGVAYAFEQAWYADHENDELIQVDPRTLKARDRVHVRLGAVRVAAGADRSLWVTNNEDTVTQVVDGRIATVRKVDVGPIGIASDGETVWVANSEDSTVTVLRGANGGRSQRIAVGRAPVAIAVIDHDAWSADQDAGTLTPLGRNADAPIELGTHPRGAVAVEWFGHREIWVVGSNPDAVVRVQL